MLYLNKRGSAPNPFLQNLGVSMANRVKSNNDPNQLLKNVAMMFKKNNLVDGMVANDDHVSLVTNAHGVKVYRHVSTCGVELIVNNQVVVDTKTCGLQSNIKSQRVEELVKSNFILASEHTQNQGDKTVDVQDPTGVVRTENIKTSTIFYKSN